VLEKKEHDMETLELPVVEELEENAPWLDHEVDLAAFRLWREASRSETGVEESSPAAED
jgi:hypothetical protein